MIRVHHLSKAYGGRRVLSDLTFELARGAHAVVAGRSGCGKTTLLRILAGLEEPDAGSVLLDGEVASEPGWVLPPHKRSMGFAFQAAALWSHMTVARHIDFATPRGAGRDAWRERLVTGLGLTPILYKVPHQLSGGEAQRVSIARAMASRPARLLLDEPLAHLDNSAKSPIIAFILEVAQESNASLIFVTHDDREASDIPGAVLCLAGGSDES